MSRPLPLNKLETWRSELGLMPVPLFGKQADERRHVLLNGGKGNFCLDLAGEEGPGMASHGLERDWAWSSDVGHYVKVEPDMVVVWRWDQSSPERYKHRTISDNIVKFQTYLEERQPSRASSVVGHFMAIYRQVRTLVGPVVNGPEALQAFLYLLAEADIDSQGAITKIDWTKLPHAKPLVDALPASQRDSLREDMLRVRGQDSLRPIIPLVLRHASGRLFQEAHYLVELDPQLSFFGSSEAKRVGKDSVQGAFFTPSPLVRTVVEESLKAQPRIDDDVTVLDPACGSAEFLREALRQLQMAGHRHRVKLIGWDVSPAALAMAQFVLDWERSQTDIDVQVELREVDALSIEDWRVGAQLTLMNPPFISWQDMSDTQRNHVLEKLGSLAAQRPDFASVFFHAAVSAMPAGGVIGAVLPASILDGTSYRGLRGAIASEVQPHLIARLGSHSVFADAVVDAGLYVGAKADLDRPVLAVWSNHKADSSPKALRRLRSITPRTVSGYVHDNGDFSVYADDTLGRGEESWAPRSYAAYRFTQQISGVSKVESIFDVSQGAITGFNNAFLVSRAYVKALPAKERRFFRPAVINSSIIGGALNDETWVFYPHGKKFELRSEKELREKLPTFFEDRLRPYQAALLKRSRIKQDQWWVLSLPREKLDAVGPKIVTTYFGGPGSFAWDADGRYVVIQGYGWAAGLAAAGLELAYVALLNHPKMDTLLAGVSNNVAGGQWNLSQRYVNHLPLPQLPREGALTETLVAIGSLLSEGQSPEEDLWTRAFMQAYGLEPRG
ncbi:N-6 DNA methylase [Pseudoxanthomonas mexicana]|uniref:N-6 DNA methylase n=1 Tax=Pseudoxanthomonas mexicana TaxID=128785 RepID=UPI001FD653B3|nr:N-6 DNA methylase [Pseudoxanthomonas mexicana]UOV00184.1 SAM-dependent methyltransferase [Pseudoxanthomonas mexicana]